MTASKGPVVAADHALRIAPKGHGCLLTEECAIEPTQIEFRWTRYWQLRQLAAVEWRVPFGVALFKQLIERLRQRCRQQPILLLAAVLEALQVDPHGVYHQQRVLGAPGRGLCAQQQVFKWPHPAVGQRRVDARCIGFEHAAPDRIECGERKHRAFTELVQADAAVGIEQRRPQ